MSTLHSGKFNGLVEQLVLMVSRGKTRKPGNEDGSSSAAPAPDGRSQSKATVYTCFLEFCLIAVTWYSHRLVGS